MKGKQLIELAYDVQSGLGNIDVPDFDQLRTMGMSATLAIHIRGLGEIDYEVLRKVSDHHFDIPSYALKDVINVLAEIEYIEIVKNGSKISSIIPDVPTFGDVYDGVGSYFSFSDLNEHEQGTMLIMSELQNKPENKDKIIQTTGINRELLNRCVTVGTAGRYMKPFRARGKDILASPFYFADNLESLVDMTAKIGATDIQKVIEIVRNNQGWPLSMITAHLELGGTKLSKAQHDLLVHLCSEGVFKPPSLKFASTTESFVFTPSPGATRLNAENREVYERAMALVSCVRKGQLLAEKYRIKMPVRLLEALRDRGYLGANSEAAIQYQNLTLLRVGTIKAVGSSKWQFHLSKTEENIRALDLAINLLRTGELANLEVNQDARLALAKDEKYIQSVISAAELKQRQKIKLDEQSTAQWEQLILEYES